MRHILKNASKLSQFFCGSPNDSHMSPEKKKTNFTPNGFKQYNSEKTRDLK